MLRKILLSSVVGATILLSTAVVASNAIQHTLTTDSNNQIHTVERNGLIIHGGDVVIGEAQDFYAGTGVFASHIIADGTRWTSGKVPYTFASEFTNEQVSMILTQFAHISSISDITFIPRTSIHQNYVHFKYNTDTDYAAGMAMLGMRGGRQNLWLNDGIPNGSYNESGGFTKRVILHELLHTLGYNHEHLRPDRDSFITIHWSNLQDATTKAFKIYDGMSTADPYDFDSIMHYASYTSGTEVVHDIQQPMFWMGAVGTNGPLLPLYWVNTTFSPLDVDMIQDDYGDSIPESTSSFEYDTWFCKGEGRARWDAFGDSVSYILEQYHSGTWVPIMTTSNTNLITYLTRGGNLRVRGVDMFGNISAESNSAYGAYHSLCTGDGIF